MSGAIVYLVTGANRGIGFGLVAALAARPNTIVFAGARDPSAQALGDLAAKHTNLHPIKLTSADKADNDAAVAQIEKVAGRLDVIIANAAICDYYGPVVDAPVSVYQDHFEVNSLGPLVLFQAAERLLLASPTGAPIFAVISSSVTSMGNYVHFSLSPYAMSKAAVNILVKGLNAEHSKLVAFLVDPGWVATQMGDRGAKANGLPGAPVQIADSVKGILGRIDGATKEKSAGKFWNAVVANNGNPWDRPTEEILW
ncbi:NAD(P)-binding protein [Favolaschia claudopus]|uniref:NAD(P)-binding protein n=1 Tax=Favolaschia claudopus TaxID=2862362 RepID=A0AAW0E433_9AGAR